MATALPLVTYSTLEEQIEALERDGYLYLPGFLNAAEVAELRAAAERIEPLPENLDTDMTPERDGYLNKCINNAFNRDPLFLKHLDKPGLIDLAEAIHGSDCHIIAMHTWLVGPGRPDQSLHTDWLPISLPEDMAADPRVRLPIFITTAHVYLDDITEEMGPTVIVPGSHRSGRAPDPAQDANRRNDRSSANGGAARSSQPAVEWNGVGEHSPLCKAGDCLFFRCELWHRGAANHSDRVRHTFMIHYAHRMIAQKFPPYLKFRFDPEIVAQASPRQRRLLGEHAQSNYD